MMSNGKAPGLSVLVPEFVKSVEAGINMIINLITRS